jgi:hypothetical protein
MSKRTAPPPEPDPVASPKLTLGVRIGDKTFAPSIWTMSAHVLEALFQLPDLQASRDIMDLVLQHATATVTLGRGDGVCAVGTGKVIYEPSTTDYGGVVKVELKA